MAWAVKTANSDEKEQPPADLDACMSVILTLSVSCFQQQRLSVAAYNSWPLPPLPCSIRVQWNFILHQFMFEVRGQKVMPDADLAELGPIVLCPQRLEWTQDGKRMPALQLIFRPVCPRRPGASFAGVVRN
jgi:hypothetical protein